MSSIENQELYYLLIDFFKTNGIKVLDKETKFKLKIFNNLIRKMEMSSLD
tara:strand:- start:218 stop:367 length:150 start_codon:yes stop_codon:yes gene_type:complete